MTRFVYVKFRNEDEPRKIEADEVVQTGIQVRTRTISGFFVNLAVHHERVVPRFKKN